ncbi:MAG: hypothetical protein C4341_00375 [Armatimonadota bacterium]
MNLEIQVRAVTKRFGDVVALSEASLTIRTGEVHALLGENGAGKTTLASILSGNLQPTSGALIVDGRNVRFRDAGVARNFGIDIVHQHFMLIPAFTVAENLALFGATDGVSELDVSPDAIVRDLSVGEQQRVEIARALASGRAVVLFDEPTAVLTPDESRQLLDRLRRLADEGRGVVLITHRVEEALAVADRITVLRGGKVVRQLTPREATEETLKTLIAGGEVQLEVSNGESHPTDEIRVLAQDVCVRSDRGHIAVAGVTLSIRAGEVVGVGGVDGNGQLELAEAIAGVRNYESGAVKTTGNVAYIPADRNRDGLALLMTVLDNLLIAGHRRRNLRVGPLLHPRRVLQWARSVLRRYHVRPQRIDLPRPQRRQSAEAPRCARAGRQA